jgi:MFS family permease
MLARPMDTPPSPADPGTGDAAATAPPLGEAARARGRRLAVASHPLGMVFSMVTSQHLPTLALVSLGASEAAIGLQTGLGPALQLLQLPTLRAVGRVSKRRILVSGQLFALAGATPLLFFAGLASLRSGAGVALAILSFAAVAAGLTVSNTVWFPLLRAYVEPGRVGRFFGLLRSGWHLSLIVYYLVAQRWLAARPGDFGPLFLVGWVLGALRIALIARLPERSERTGERIRVRGALALLRQREFRLYLSGVTTSSAVRLCVVPFAIVMLRREVGLSEAQVVLTTIAHFAGGLASLYLWGRVVDRVGAAPVFRWTSIGMGLLYLSLLFLAKPDAPTLAAAVAFFFGLSVLASGFGVADTHVLFGLTPPEAPARMLVVASVVVNTAVGALPLAAGLALQHWIARAADPLSVYGVFFCAAAVVQVLAFAPLRHFRG